MSTLEEKLFNAKIEIYDLKNRIEIAKKACSDGYSTSVIHNILSGISVNNVAEMIGWDNE